MTNSELASTWMGLTVAMPFLIGLIALFTLIMMIGLITNTNSITKQLDEILKRMEKNEKKIN